MKIQYCSDLHLEFRDNREYLRKNPLQPIGDILLLAGDIVPFTIIGQHNYFFDMLSDSFEQVYWVPGNHEYYHWDAALRSGTIREEIRRNVHLVNNISVQHKDIKFVFSTLWSMISPANEAYIQGSINDFSMIKFNGHILLPSDFNCMHENSKSFIKEEIDKPHDGKTVIVTHHVPTFLHYPEKHKASKLNEAFAVELFDIIGRSGIDNWIYGHHHSNVPDFPIGKTRLLTNQLGYVRMYEHHLFDPAKTIKL